MTKSKFALFAALFCVAAGVTAGASAQQVACLTPVGAIPIMLPPGVPALAGIPCSGPAGAGISIIVGGGFSGGPMSGPFQGGQLPAGFSGGPMPAPFPGRPMPAGFPGAAMPGPFSSGYPVSPQGMAAGQIAGAFGVNHEGQVAAECTAQFGVTYAAGGCVASRLTADELNKCFSDGIGGRGCFGDNNTLVSMIRSNVEGARRENGAVNQTVRATTGISVRDIQEHGPLGGNNSVFHCPFGGC